MEKKQLVILAGPNGCGKTTLADLLRADKVISTYVNADLIAQGMSISDGELSAISAGRALLNRVEMALENGESFAFESTMAGRSWTKLIKRAQALGYEVTICFAVVDSVEIALARIRERVKEGGHDIPSEVVERRFVRSRELFATHYRKICDRWYVFDNTGSAACVIAAKENGNPQIEDQVRYRLHFGSYEN